MYDKLDALIVGAIQDKQEAKFNDIYLGSRHSECGRKAIGLPPVERTVASIPDADLMRRAVRNVVQRRPKRQEFAWSAVSEVFGLGSTFSAQLCRRFGIDPDTGKDLMLPNTKADRP